MKISAFKQMIKESLEDAKKDKKDKAAKLPKSSGKLVDMKKELEALKQMKDELQTAKFAEKTASTEVEFANLAKFKSELDKIKAGGVALEAKIDSRITELETKIGDEKNKIREMIGLAPKAGQQPIADAKEPEIEEEEAEEAPEAEELDEAKKTKPKLKVSAIVTKKKEDKKDDKKVVAKKPVAKKK